MSYKKTRLVPSGHPDKKTQEDFVHVMLKTIRQAKYNKQVVLFLDPAHQVHNVDSNYCWQRKGKSGTKRIPSNSGRERLTIIGAINVTTHRPTILTTEGNCDGLVMQAFLREVRNDYPTTKTITIFLDNAKYNHSHLVRDEAKKLHIKLLFLPPYSPNLNLIERLWKFMKKQVTANRYYKTFTEFKQAIDDFFKHIDQYTTALDTLLTLKFEIL